MNQREFIEFIRAIDAASAGAPSVEQWASVRRELANVQEPNIDQFVFFQARFNKISESLGQDPQPGRKAAALLAIGRASVGG